MKEIQKLIQGRGEVKGYTFKQIEANEHGYIYEVIGGAKPRWEVFKRKENTQFNCVSYPSSKAFGLWATQTFDLSKAMYILKGYAKERIKVDKTPNINT